MHLNKGLQAYAQVSLESKLTGATPHQLISMLFDGAHNALVRAKIYREANNVAGRGEMISKAIGIIDNGLKAALDHEKGGAIAGELESLYEYMSHTLLKANLRNDPDLITHIDALLMNISTAWKEIE